MQASVPDEEEKPKAGSSAAADGLASGNKLACSWLREKKIRDLVKDKRRLVEIPYTATLSHTINVLLANDVVAVPVAAPPGRWIGAGGSMILESDPVTGAVRKHYIGMVTALDILVHIAEEEGEDAPSSPRSPRLRASASAPEFVGVGHQPPSDLDRRLSVPVSSVIGHSLEGLSLWTLNPSTSLLDCMEAFSKGVHRALVPVESTQGGRVVAAELVEASPGYRMLTQMDVVSFLSAHGGAELRDVTSRTVAELGAVNASVLSITKRTRVIDALKSMRAASLSSVPIVEAEHGESGELNERKGRKLLGTFSATDLRAVPIDELQAWLGVSVVEFKAKASRRPSFNRTTLAAAAPARLSLVTCFPETALAEVIRLAVAAHVHKVWVVDGGGHLTGLVSLTDMLRVIREAAVAAELYPS